MDQENQKTLIINEPSLQEPLTQKKFVMIPNVIMMADNLSASAKYLYGLLVMYAWQDGCCWPGQKRLAKDANTNDKTIRRWLNELLVSGLVTWKRRGLTQTNVYTLNKLADIGWVVQQETASPTATPER